MPGKVTIDLAPLWHREVACRVPERTAPNGDRPGRSGATFALAFEVASAQRTGGLVSATYPLTRFEDAVGHTGAAGRLGAVKIAFDVRKEQPDEPPTRLRPRGGLVSPHDPVLERGSRSRRSPGQPGNSRRPADDGDRRPLPGLSTTLCSTRSATRALAGILRPGMKLTICFDDVSLPLPPMEAPDIRQMVIETVLDMAARRAWTTSSSSPLWPCIAA